MKKFVLPFFLLMSTVSLAQWSPTSSYYAGQISGISSSPEAICMLTNSGVSMVKAKDARWYPLAAMSGYSSPVIAGNDTIIIIGEGNSYNISHDGGASWAMQTGPVSPQFLGIMDQVLIVIDQENNLFFSTDYGITWKQSPGFFVSSNSVISTVMDNEVFAIQYYGNGIEKLYKCAFDGVSFTSWQYVKSFPQDEYHNDLISYNGILYMAASSGVKKSSDKGVTWNFVGNAIGETSQIRIDSSNIYAYFGMSGYSISSYSFKTNKWSSILPAFNDTIATNIAACEGRFYASLSRYFGEAMGLFRYLDGKWFPIAALPVGVVENEIRGVRKIDRFLITSVWDVTSAQGGFVYSSSDAGSTWSPCESSVPWSLNDAVYSGDNFLIAGNSGVGILDTATNTITRTTGINGYQAFSFEKLGTVLYAGTGDGIYISTNNGANWSYKYLKGKIVYKLKVCRDTLFAGTDQGLFFSKNGTTWGSTSCLIADIKDIAATSKDIFVTSVSGLLKKIDSLNIWLPLETSLIGTDVNALIARGGRLYAGTAHGTVLYTDDGGTTWMDISDARFSNITGFDISGNELFVSEKGSGVWIYPAEWPSGIDPGKGLSSLAIFPNPARDQITLLIPDEFREMCTVEVSTISGVIFKNIPIWKPLDRKLKLNIEDLPVGFYLVTLGSSEIKISSGINKTE